MAASARFALDPVRLGKVYFSVPISRISSELTVKLVDDIDTRVSTGKYKTVTAVYSEEEWRQMNE